MFKMYFSTIHRVDEIVRKQFTLEFRPTKATTEFAECKEMQKVQRHSLDTKSEEAASMCAPIYLINVSIKY